MSHTETARRKQLEAHYCKSPFVKECCVLPLHQPGQLGREQLYAVVVPNMDLLRRRKIVNAGDLLRFELEGLSHALPPLERVLAYEIWFEPLPRTSAQEIDRPDVERRIRARQLARVFLHRARC